ncbi:hypothetical protein GCM10010270_37700 [Streptomyces violaceus]|nr:hypothetical protein GCM10010270_37700 [Streptomyces janthinus]
MFCCVNFRPPVPRPQSRPNACADQGIPHYLADSGIFEKCLASYFCSPFFERFGSLDEGLGVDEPPGDTEAMTTTPLSLPEVEALAREAHAHQTDKAGRPYAEHLRAVAEGVRARDDDEQIAAAWLHDAVEDDALTEEWLREAALTRRTKDIVLALTKRTGEPSEAYARRILDTPGAVLAGTSPPWTAHT